jgi:methyl-accepting chemotaxis protein
MSNSDGAAHTAQASQRLSQLSSGLRDSLRRFTI